MFNNCVWIYDVHSGCNAAMPHPHLHLLHARLMGDQHGGAGVPQVMESDTRQTVLFEHFRKALADIVRSDEVSEWIDADHIEVLF